MLLRKGARSSKSKVCLLKYLITWWNNTISNTKAVPIIISGRYYSEKREKWEFLLPAEALYLYLRPKARTIIDEDFKKPSLSI